MAKLNFRLPTQWGNRLKQISKNIGEYKLE